MEVDGPTRDGTLLSIGHLSEGKNQREKKLAEQGQVQGEKKRGRLHGADLSSSQRAGFWGARSAEDSR